MKILEIWHGELTQSVVRIFGQDKTTPVGSGFVLDSSHIMTCAHVVGTALDIHNIPPGMPAPYGRHVWIDLPAFRAPDSEPSPTTVLADHWRPRGKSVPDDIAVLQLAEPKHLPTAARPVLACRQTNLKDIVLAFGVKAGLPDGTWVEGYITGGLGLGRVEVFAEHPGQAIREGCSGGAAWNLNRGGLTGMVVEMHTATQGRIIPVEELQKVLKIEFVPEPALRRHETIFERLTISASGNVNPPKTILKLQQRTTHTAAEAMRTIDVEINELREVLEDAERKEEISAASLHLFAIRRRVIKKLKYSGLNEDADTFVGITADPQLARRKNSRQAQIRNEAGRCLQYLENLRKALSSINPD